MNGLSAIKPKIQGLPFNRALLKEKPFAGYESQQNLQTLEDKGVTAYVKHNQFDREQKDTIRDKKSFATDKLYYNKEKDCYYCQMGQAMNNIGTSTKTTFTDS